MTARAAFLFTALSALVAGPTIAHTYIIRPDGTGDFPTIQTAIDATDDGDIIELADGTFAGQGNQQIDYLGKAITIISQNGPAATTIDGGHVSSVVSFRSHEDGISTLESVTITNGAGTETEFPAYPLARYGGGIYCVTASPTIRNCIIVSNDARFGGGMWSYESSPALIECSFRNNSSASAGGALYLRDGSPTLIACSIRENSSGGGNNYYGGGGMYISYSAPYLRDCEIASNTATYGGGMGMNLFATPVFENCTIVANTATYWGGGILNTQCFMTLFGCDIIQNSSTSSGGGIFLYYCVDDLSPSLSDCTIADNYAAGVGGAINCRNSGVNLTSCTLYGNEAVSVFGGGIDLESDSQANLERSIIAFSSGEAITCWGDSDASLTCCDVYGNTNGDWTGCITGQNGINGNVSEDPLFCGPLDGSTPTWHSGTSPVSLHFDSPCLPGNHPDDYDCDLIGAHGQGCGRSVPRRNLTSARNERAVIVESTTWGRIKAGYR